MGLPAKEQKDLEAMCKLIDEIDFSTKYTIFFSDVQCHEKEMIEKNEQCVDEYLKTFKIFKPLGFVVTAVLLIVACLIFMLEYNVEFGKHFNGDLFRVIVNEIVTLFKNSTLPIENMSTLLRSVLKLDLFYVGVFIIYDVYLIVRFFVDLVKFEKEKKRMRIFLENKKEIISKEYAREILPELRKAIMRRKQILEKLYIKHNIDTRLRNRENIEYIQTLAKINEKKNITLKDLEEFIINKNLIKETFDDHLWCKALLVYDIAFPYYKIGNPFTADLKKKRSETVTVLMIIFWPLTIYYYCFKIIWFYLKALFTPSELSPVVGTKIEDRVANYQSNLGVVDNNDAKSQNMDTFLYHDMGGNLCSSDGLFVDGKGNLCEPGNWFYDFKGELCSPESAFYDSRGILRYPGEPFYDGKDYLIFPKA